MNYSRHVAKLSLLLWVALIAVCGGPEAAPPLPEPCDRVGHPDFTGSGYGAIGPEGGMIEVTDPLDRLAGVRVEVPQGAWDECREVRIRYQSMFDTPDYDDGFMPFERPRPTGSVDVQIGLTTSPDGNFVRTSKPLPFTLSFPLDIPVVATADAAAIAAAFYTDAAHSSWHMKFPTTRDDARLSIETDEATQIHY